MDQKGQLVDAMIGGLVALIVFMALVPVFDAVLNTTFNVLNDSTDISQVGSIQLILGLVVFVIAIGIFVMIVKTALGQRPPQAEGI